MTLLKRWPVLACRLLWEMREKRVVDRTARKALLAGLCDRITNADVRN